MMKRLFMILISFVLCLSLLSGCGKTEELNQNSDNDQLSNGSEFKEDVENLLSDVTPENEDNKNEPIENNKEPDNPEVVPYTTRVKAPFNIFDKPGYDYNLVDTVWEKGLFTIVEEKNDEEGKLWGKLKSGLGWIDLTRIENESKLPVRAGLIEGNELPKEYQKAILDESEYMVRLAFIANEDLKDIRLTSIYLTDDGIVDDTLHTLNELKEDQMFVAGVVFTGDMTTFGLEFVDASGETQYYAAYISGRNGELILQEQETIVR